MIINVNDKLWTPAEREEIILNAAQKYENAKRRVRTFDKPPEKHLVIEIEDDVTSSSSDEDDDCLDYLSSSADENTLMEM